MKSVPNAPKGYVHFAATENDTLLCVKDRNGVISKVRLQAKNSRSIYGAEPLTVFLRPCQAAKVSSSLADRL